MDENKLTQIAQLLNESRSHAAANPSHEVQLLQALKTRIGEEKHNSIDRVIHLYEQFEALRQVVNRLPQTTSKNTISAMCQHSDGVYEVDEHCLRNKTNPPNEIILLLLMLQTLNNH